MAIGVPVTLQVPGGGGVPIRVRLIAWRRPEVGEFEILDTPIVGPRRAVLAIHPLAPMPGGWSAWCRRRVPMLAEPLRANTCLACGTHVGVSRFCGDCGERTGWGEPSPCGPGAHAEADTDHCPRCGQGTANGRPRLHFP